MKIIKRYSITELIQSIYFLEVIMNGNVLFSMRGVEGLQVNSPLAQLEHRNENDKIEGK